MMADDDGELDFKRVTKAVIDLLRRGEAVIRCADDDDTMIVGLVIMELAFDGVQVVVSGDQQRQEITVRRHEERLGEWEAGEDGTGSRVITTGRHAPQE